MPDDWQNAATGPPGSAPAPDRIVTVEAPGQQRAAGGDTVASIDGVGHITPLAGSGQPAEPRKLNQKIEDPGLDAARVKLINDMKEEQTAMRNAMQAEHHQFMQEAQMERQLAAQQRLAQPQAVAQSQQPMNPGLLKRNLPDSMLDGLAPEAQMLVDATETGLSAVDSKVAGLEAKLEQVYHDLQSRADAQVQAQRQQQSAGELQALTQKYGQDVVQRRMPELSKAWNAGLSVTQAWGAVAQDEIATQAKQEYARELQEANKAEQQKRDAADVFTQGGIVREPDDAAYDEGEDFAASWKKVGGPPTV